VAAVLVHIDLPHGDRGRADASSLTALAAGRALATSWGASLYAGVIMAAPVRATAALEAELVRGGVDRIVIAPTLGELAPLWDSLGNAWQNVLAAPMRRAPTSSHHAPPHGSARATCRERA
jgi:hypothetical protein